MSYNVFYVETVGIRNHKAIYIESNPSAPPETPRGRLHHVTGTILAGMNYDPRDTVDPEFTPEYVPASKRKIATIAADDLPRFESECCEFIPPPRPQMTLSGKQLYPGTPLYRCGDWLRDVENLAVEKGILKR